MAGKLAEIAEIDKRDPEIVEEKPNLKEIGCFSFGQAVVEMMGTINDEGEAIVEDLQVTFRKRHTTYIDRRVTSIDGIKLNLNPSVLPTVGMGKYDLPFGSGIVVGPEDTGKSPFLQAMLTLARETAGDESAGAFVRYGEPLPGYLSDERDAAIEIMRYMLDSRCELICIDSVKDLLSVMDGPAMARGIPRSFWRMVSNWGTFAAAFGKAIVVPLNISTDQADAIAEVESAVKSNITNAFVYDAERSSKLRGEFIYTCVARQGESLQRKVSKWVLSFPNNQRTLDITEMNKANTVDNRIDEPTKYIKLTSAVTNAAIIKTLRNGE